MVPTATQFPALAATVVVRTLARDADAMTASNLALISTRDPDRGRWRAARRTCLRCVEESG